MPDYSSTAYTVVSSPVLAGQQGGCKERPYGNMAGASVAHASRSVMCATASRGGSRGAGPNASSSTQGAVSRSGADRITQQQELDTLATPPPPNGSDAPNVHNPTAHTACERVLGVYMRSSAGLSVSDVSLHKLSQYLPPSVFQLLEVLGSASRLQKLLKAYGGPVFECLRCGQRRTILYARYLASGASKSLWICTAAQICTFPVVPTLCAACGTRPFCVTMRD